MTPQRIADISEPIEQLYGDLTDELLINIAKHLSKATATWSALHEIETLQEMGQLTEENIKIINDYVKRIPQEIKDAMNESRLEALGEIEKKLADAAADGYLTQPVTDRTVEVAQALSNQAADQLNLVNQTMLNSSLQAYQTGVYEFRQEMNNLAIKTIETEQQLDIAQNELNKAAGQVVAGTENRTVALRKCIRKLNDAGIIGYYDRLNRAWTAEAYVNMNIRTTVHNTYIQSIKTRQQEYGSDVFQVSSHAGARPLCYPYQGKFYSWSGRAGEITLGDGKKYPFEPIGVTSYGEPAGLFGINCGHVPYPMINNVSEPVKEDIPNEEENTREYQESQQQRLLERQIRNAKREVELLGDLAEEKDIERVKRAQARMREFIKETGRTRRYDREQIVSKRSDAPTAARPKVTKPKAPNTPIDYKEQSKATLRNIYENHRLRNNLTSTPVNELGEDFFKAQYGNIDEETVKTFSNTLQNLSQKYDTTLTTVKLMGKNEYVVLRNAFATTYHDYETDVSTLMLNPVKLGKYDKYVERIKELQSEGYAAKIDEKYAGQYVVTHEFAHTLIDMETPLDKNRNWVGADYKKIEGIRKEIKAVYNDYLKEYQDTDKERKKYELEFMNSFDESAFSKAQELQEELNKLHISKYALTNSDEFMAECFTQKTLGGAENEYVDKIMDIIDKNFAR